ncbi:unnamed protein product [Musa acuminata subsp. burmannicoides]
MMLNPADRDFLPIKIAPMNQNFIVAREVDSFLITLCSSIFLDFLHTASAQIRESPSKSFVTGQKCTPGKHKRSTALQSYFLQDMSNSCTTKLVVLNHPNGSNSAHIKRK